MLYDVAQVRDNLRTREGKRVFFLGKGDQLTSAARDWLRRERVDIRPADQAKMEEYRLLSGGTLQEKPENMTHLTGNILVSKDHPRIIFRGKLDTLQAQLLLAGQESGAPVEGLREILTFTREILKCEVLDQPLSSSRLLGLDEEEIHHRSHFPQEYYGTAHFMPEFGQGAVMARLNLCRCLAREAEIGAVAAFPENQRPDILRAMNRLSSALYLLMLREKSNSVS